MSEKITDRHLHRKAILYVRQSTARQLQHNEESRRLQYAMKDKLVSLGWRDTEVIDEDLGRSASGVVERRGFQRMVSEVCLGHVGVVAAREVSRFSRNSRDWQQLVEVCRLVDTLLLDQETVYDPRNSNDRLLLGLKGSLNEYELDLLRLRAFEAKKEKARRGEYYAKIAVGYRKNDDGELEKHPDRHVRQVIGLLFDKVLELGSARQLLLWLNEEGIQLPRNRGEQVIWKNATYGHLNDILRHPIYAGTYVHGRTQARRQLIDGELRTKVVPVPKEQWVVIHDHHESYTSRDQFERIQEMISRNAQTRRSTGAAKRGGGLLVGLLRCRRCGRKLMVNYSGTDNRVHRYACDRGNSDEGVPRCISFSGIDIDQRIAAELLDVVRPAAVEASIAAYRESLRADDELLETLRVELEAARFAADRARRQYDAVEPENRLVADELEGRWNQALERLSEIEQRVQLLEGQHGDVQPPDPVMYARLPAELDRVWNDSNVDVRLKKRLARTIIEEIVVDLDDDGSEIVAVIHWKGGVHTKLRVPWLRRGRNRSRTPVETVDAVRHLALICDDASIARWLSKNGSLTARGNSWSATSVASLRYRLGIPRYSLERRRAGGWLTKKQAAQLLKVAEKTVQRAVERGELTAIRPLPHGPWIFNETDLRRPEVLARFEQCRSRLNASREVPPGGQLSLEITPN